MCKLKKTMVLIVAIFANNVFGLINPNFTPIHLTKQSDVIMKVIIEDKIDEAGNLIISATEILKGDKYDLKLKLTEESILEFKEYEFFEEEYDNHTALIFICKDKDNNETGNINFGGNWYLFQKATDKTWSFKEDKNITATMKAVWDGSVKMLTNCVKYIIKDSGADVPVHPNGKWKKKMQIGKVAGTCNAIYNVNLSADSATLIVANNAGDKAFKFENDKFIDVTNKLKLSSKSNVAIFADINKDFKLDIISFDGKTITAFLQSEKGSFEEKVAIYANEKCQDIALIDLGNENNVGIVVSTDTAPVLLSVDKSGKTFSKILSFENVIDMEEVGETRNCVIGDFNGDSFTDIILPFECCATIYAGDEKGNFKVAEFAETWSEGENPLTQIGDFNADGKFDVFLSFKNNPPNVWMNDCNKSFIDNEDELGESDYSVKQNQTNSIVGEFDGDGRQDFMIFYKKTGMHGYFNRGFSTFGYALGALDPMGLIKESSAGQQCGVITDLDDDGATDIAVVLSDGTIWGMFIECNDNQKLMVKVQFPENSSFNGPLKVIGYDDQRCLGARNIYPGISAYFAKREAGPITLKWKYPNGKEQEEEIILMDGQVKYQLNIDGGEEL